jgi:hypothetical protein
VPVHRYTAHRRASDVVVELLRETVWGAYSKKRPKEAESVNRWLLSDCRANNQRARQSSRPATGSEIVDSKNYSKAAAGTADGQEWAREQEIADLERSLQLGADEGLLNALGAEYEAARAAKEAELSAEAALMRPRCARCRVAIAASKARLAKLEAVTTLLAK